MRSHFFTAFRFLFFDVSVERARWATWERSPLTGRPYEIVQYVA